MSSEMRERVKVQWTCFGFNRAPCHEVIEGQGVYKMIK